MACCRCNRKHGLCIGCVCVKDDKAYYPVVMVTVISRLPPRRSSTTYVSSTVRAVSLAVDPHVSSLSLDGGSDVQSSSFHSSESAFIFILTTITWLMCRHPVTPFHHYRHSGHGGSCLRLGLSRWSILYLIY